MDMASKGGTNVKAKALYVSEGEVQNVINALLMVGSSFVARNEKQETQKRLVMGLASLIEHAPLVEYPPANEDADKA